MKRNVKIHIDLPKLSEALGVPVIGTNARDNQGLEALKEAVLKVASGRAPLNPLVPRYSAPVEKAVSIIEPYVREAVNGRVNSRWAALRLLDQGLPFLEHLRRQLKPEPLEMDGLSAQLAQCNLPLGSQPQNTWVDEIVSALVGAAEQIGKSVVTLKNTEYQHFDRKLDHLLTSRYFGIPVMIALWNCFWITIVGANYPSELLATGFGWKNVLAPPSWRQEPGWLHGILILGVFGPWAGSSR